MGCGASAPVSEDVAEYERDARRRIRDEINVRKTVHACRDTLEEALREHVRMFPVEWDVYSPQTRSVFMSWDDIRYRIGPPVDASNYVIARAFKDNQATPSVLGLDNNVMIDVCPAGVTFYWWTSGPKPSFYRLAHRMNK
jgi:hypothetical protein